MRTSQDKECIFLWIMETVPFDEALEVYVQLPVWVAFKKRNWGSTVLKFLLKFISALTFDRLWKNSKL